MWESCEGNPQKSKLNFSCTIIEPSIISVVFTKVTGSLNNHNECFIPKLAFRLWSVGYVWAMECGLWTALLYRLQNQIHARWSWSMWNRAARIVVAKRPPTRRLFSIAFINVMDRFFKDNFWMEGGAGEPLETIEWGPIWTGLYSRIHQKTQMIAPGNVRSPAHVCIHHTTQVSM